MGKLEDRAKHNTNAAGEGRRLRSDPIVQASDQSNRSGEGMQPLQIVPTTQKQMSIADATLLPDEPLGSGQLGQAVPSATELLAPILRFKWTVLAVTVLVAAPIIAVAWTQILPKYQARAELRARPYIQPLLFDTEETGSIRSYGAFLNTQLAIMESKLVLQRVLDQQDVQETQWCTKPPTFLQRLRGNPTDPVKRLRYYLEADPRHGTEIIDVTFVDTNPKDAALIANAVVDQYMTYYALTSDKSNDDLYTRLMGEYNSFQAKIQGHEATIAGLRKSLGTSNPTGLISLKRLRLDEAQARLGQLQYIVSVLEKADSNDVAFALAQPEYHEDAEWRRLDLSVRTIEQQIASNRLTLKPKHSRMVHMEKELELAKEQRKEREELLDEQPRDGRQDASAAPTAIAPWPSQPVNVLTPIATTDANTPGSGQSLVVVSQLGDQPEDLAGAPIATADTSTPGLGQGFVSVGHQLAQLKRQEKLLLEKVEKQREEFDNLFQAAQLLEKENSRLRHAQGLFGALQRRLDRKNMERNAPGWVTVHMAAAVPSEPFSDPRKKFTAMALLMGLCTGAGVAFLRGYMNQAVHTVKDMPCPMQGPFLGYIPVSQIRRSIGKSLSDEFLRIRARRIESIRLVRTALLSRLNGHAYPELGGGGTTILVTSAAAGTGKSTFTLMLGKSLAQAGRKVLMIDADLRKMTLSKRFGLSGESGFIEALRRRSAAKQNVFPTETSGLSIMPAGGRRNKDGVFEGTANGAFRACIGQLRNQYNVILLDSAPILPLADAIILSGQVDGTVMVERESVSHRRHVTDALSRLDSAGGRLVGTVLVGSGGSDSRKDYGYAYYDYDETGKS